MTLLASLECSLPAVAIPTIALGAITANQLNEQEKETAINLALTILAEKHQPDESLTSPEHTTAYLQTT